MCQPFQACNLRIKLPRRLEEPRDLSDPGCLCATCMGVLMVTLGILVIVFGISDPMTLCIGTALTATGVVFTVLPGALALCSANQNSQSLGEAEASASPPEWTPPSVVASTFL